MTGGSVVTLSIKELPKAAWNSVYRWTAIIIVASAAISALVSEIIMGVVSEGLDGPGLAAAIALPILVGGPTIFFHLIRLQQLRLANQKLQVLASTDWLTATLNRRA